MQLELGFRQIVVCEHCKGHWYAPEKPSRDFKHVLVFGHDNCTAHIVYDCEGTPYYVDHQDAVTY